MFGAGKKPTLANPVLAILDLPGQFWPKPILDNPSFGHRGFGQCQFLAKGIFGQVNVWGPKGPIVCFLKLIVQVKFCGVDVGGWRKVGTSMVGPRRVGPRRVWARTVGAQNFALFFPSPATVFHSFSLSFGLFRGILVVFEAPGRSNVHVWSSGAVVCEPWRPGLVGPPGFHTTTREPNRAHLRVPVFKNTTKIQRKGPTREGEKNKNCGGRGEKEERNFGRSGGGGSGGGGSGGGCPAERP